MEGFAEYKYRGTDGIVIDHSIGGVGGAGLRKRSVLPSLRLREGP